MVFVEIFLSGHGGMSRAGRIVSSCPLSRDLIHLACSLGASNIINSYSIMNLTEFECINMVLYFLTVEIASSDTKDAKLMDH